MSKSPTWVIEPVVPSPWRIARRLLAGLLRRASARLAAVARRLHAAEASRPGDASPVIEFHAEAGAPEGALFVDGVRVGTLPGVTRL